MPTRERLKFVSASRRNQVAAATATRAQRPIARANGGLSPTLCYDGQIFQIFQQFFVVGDRKNNGGAVASIVRYVLNRIAHAGTIAGVDRGLNIGRLA